MANPQDAGQPIDRVAATNDDDVRENIPPAFRYGKVETISLAPFQRWRSPDNGNGSYNAESQMIFFLETGGAAFLNPKCTYLTFTFTPTVTTGKPDADVATVAQCMLDHNTDAIFNELDLQANGTTIEHLYTLNLYQNVKYLLENGGESINSAVQSVVTANTAGDITVNPSYYIYNVKADEAWFGASQIFPRRGALLTTAIAYQMAWHVKSNHIGINAQTTFPLAFINQCMLTLKLDKSVRTLRNCSIQDDDGAQRYLDIWTYALKNVRLHYTLIMVQDEVAASIQKAYLSNALPNYMHSVRTYTWMQSPLFVGPNFTYSFSLSGSSYDTLYFILQSNNAWTGQDFCSLSNFGGGYLYAQVKVNGQGIPANRIDTSATAASAYELYQMTAYATGKPFMKNNLIPIESTTITGYVLTAATIATDFAGILTVTADGYNNNFSYAPREELWNSVLVTEIVPGDALGTTAVFGTLRQQGCTVLAVSLVDYWAMQGQNVKGGTAIRGANVQVDIQLAAAVGQNAYLTMFALQDALLVMKGTSAGLLT